MRSPAALDRLDDVVPLLLCDRRVEVWFAVDPGSRFSGRLHDRLHAAGALLVDWHDVDRHEFDLVLAASENSDLVRLRGPVVLLPHGAGYHRRSPLHRDWPSGLRPTALIDNDKVLPHTIVVANESQLGVMRAVDPRLPDHALVAGDPCLDRLRAGFAQRNLHRRAYRADDRRLVLLCSTWGQSSLYGQRPDLAEHLVTHLPADEYRVVLTLHPNVWERHGPLQVTAWLRRAVAAGLVVVPPTGDWRPALLAADLVISDHGSLSFYADALGLTTLIAADGGDEVVPHSPMADLLARLPRLTDADPSEIATVPATPAPAPPTVLTRHFYALLDLPAPDDPPPPPVIPVPTVEVPEPQHFHAMITSSRIYADHAEITLRRTTARWTTDTAILTASAHCDDLAILERAGAVYAHAPAEAISGRFPGARITIVASGDRIAFTTHGQTRTASTTATASATAAALHWWTTLPAPRPSTIHVHTGATRGTVTVEG